MPGICGLAASARRKAESGERPLGFVLRHKNHAHARQRAEMTRLQFECFFDVAHGGIKLAHQIEHGRPFVPALGEIRIHVRHISEAVQRLLEIAL